MEETIEVLKGLKIGNLFILEVETWLSGYKKGMLQIRNFLPCSNIKALEVHALISKLDTKTWQKFPLKKSWVNTIGLFQIIY